MSFIIPLVKTSVLAGSENTWGSSPFFTSGNFQVREMAKAANFHGETIFSLRPLDSCSPLSCGPSSALSDGGQCVVNTKGNPSYSHSLNFFVVSAHATTKTPWGNVGVCQKKISKGLNILNSGSLICRASFFDYEEIDSECYTPSKELTA